MYTFYGKTALITGSTAGLGKQLAMDLLREGAQVVINGRNEENLRKARQQLEASGSRVVALQGDVSKPEECQKLIRDCIRESGRLDILINNAGTGSNGLFMDTVPEVTRKVIGANLLGSIYTTYYALPHILESRGSILFISSLAGIYGLPYSSTYSISKMAITALVQALRIELSSSAVHTGIIYVGFLKNSPEKRIIGCDGQLVPKTGRPERFSMSLEKASAQIIKTIIDKKPVKVMSGLGKLFYQVNRVSPAFVRRILAKSMVSMKFAYTPGGVMSTKT
ncbi:MAG TPA: SDR family NAD(P)-dependent oxidoreductase [Bacteroides sp.]|nr:SDR family NAD(P)-dependent oxidoreductase [Bacteroides sp.]